MTTHTPGPWRIGQQGFDNGGFPETVIVADASGGKVVAPCVCLHFEHYPEMREANAHLISAAPELLAACEVALAGMELTGVYPDTIPVTALRAAIAKAKGGAK